MWLLLGVIDQLLPQTDVTSFIFLISASPFRFFWSPWIQNKGWIIKYFELWPCCKVCLAHCVPAVWHSPPSLVYPVRVPYLSHSGLLLAGKRETCFHSAVQLLVEYMSQVAYLLPFNLEANDYVGAVTFGLRQDCHFVLATDWFFALHSSRQIKVFAAQPDNAQ